MGKGGESERVSLDRRNIFKPKTYPYSTCGRHRHGEVRDSPKVRPFAPCRNWASALLPVERLEIKKNDHGEGNPTAFREGLALSSQHQHFCPSNTRMVNKHAAATVGPGAL